MTINIEHRGIWVLNQSDLEDRLDELITARERVKELEAANKQAEAAAEQLRDQLGIQCKSNSRLALKTQQLDMRHAEDQRHIQELEAQLATALEPLGELGYQARGNSRTVAIGVDTYEEEYKLVIEW